MKSLLKRLLGTRRVVRFFTPIPGERRAFLLEMLPKCSVGAEIGVHMGDFSQEILRIVKPVTLHLIDPWKHEDSATYKEAWYGGKAKGEQSELDARYEAVLRRFGPAIDSGQAKVHRGYSQHVAESFPNGYFDWVYIDGNHLYEFVRKDLLLYFHKVKDGGYLTGDDCGEGGWWNGGVKKAVDEFILSNPFELVRITNNQFLLKKLAIPGSTCTS